MSSSLRPLVRPYASTDWPGVLDTCMQAFAPIYAGFEHALGHELFALLYPDWKASSELYLRSICEQNVNQGFLVAEVRGQVAGFVHYEFDGNKQSGELGLNAVHPRWQRHGIAVQMYLRVMEIMQAKELKFVRVSTGGDSAHLPARLAYAKCGFVPLPIVNYFKKL